MFNYFKNKSQQKRIKYLLDYEFNIIVLNRFRTTKLGSELSTEGMNQVITDLKVYFLMVLLKGKSKGLILMYNKTVDELWHTFIIDTVEYTKFCENVFGKYLHHQLTDRQNEEEMTYNEHISQECYIKALNILKEIK